MKISDKKSEFVPVVMTIETRSELAHLYHTLNCPFTQTYSTDHPRVFGISQKNASSMLQAVFKEIKRQGIPIRHI